MTEHIADVKPHKENILVFPVPLMKERTLPGSGIVLPETQLEFHDKPRWGTVIAVGSMVTEVRPADQVLIREGAGASMMFQDSFEEGIKEYLFVKEEHIMMRFNRDNEPEGREPCGYLGSSGTCGCIIYQGSNNCEGCPAFIKVDPAC